VADDHFVTVFFIRGGAAGAGATLLIADLGATNRFCTTETLGFVVSTAGEAAATGSEFATAESSGRGAERPVITRESCARERERGEIRSARGEW
jgi:hypothetical protein